MRFLNQKIDIYTFQKRNTFIVFIIYIFTVIWFTVLHRNLHFFASQVELFWSYKAWLTGDVKLGREILANIAMFIPFGFLFSSILSSHLRKKSAVVIISAIIFSFTIETLQLFLMRGLFEWDDVVSNTIGAVVGVGLFLTVDRLVSEKYRAITMKSLTAIFMIACVVVIIRGHGGAEADNTSGAYCFQVDSLSRTNSVLTIEGFCFRYEHPSSYYSLVLKAQDGTRVEMEKEIVSRPDVNAYFSCDYSSSGFTARAEVDEGEYEILIKWPWSIAISTGVFVSPSGVHYVKEDEFTQPAIEAEFVEDGVLRVYRPDYHCWVYQWDGALYWIVDQDFFFEDDGSTYIQYQLWTTQTQNLPARRLENGHLWDNIGGYFEEYAVEGNWNGYRVMKRELPTAYPITSILTGYHKDGEWIWQNYFRPYYEFE